MEFPDKETLSQLRVEYPTGTQVELVQWGPSEMIDDNLTVPPGTVGVVTGVDDAGNINVNWENGHNLSVVRGIDKVRKLEVGDA